MNVSVESVKRAGLVLKVWGKLLSHHEAWPSERGSRCLASEARAHGGLVKQRVGVAHGKHGSGVNEAVLEISF